MLFPLGRAKALILSYDDGKPDDRELEGTQPKWEETEKFFKMVANNPLIYYTTQIDLVDYINAWRNLKFSVDKNRVQNLSSLNLYFRYRGKSYTVLPGKMLLITE